MNLEILNTVAQNLDSSAIVTHHKGKDLDGDPYEYWMCKTGGTRFSSPDAECFLHYILNLNK